MESGILNFKPEKEGTARLFRNRYLDWLTRTSPWVIIPLDLSISAMLLWVGHYRLGLPWERCAWLFPAGMFTWTLVEYLMHRFAFHFPAQSEKGQKVIYTIHVVHHHYPHDKDRLFQPPLVNIVLASVFLGIFYLLMGSSAFFFTPGFVVGYIAYSSLHYSIHTFKPPFPFLKKLWRHHTLHHYRCPDRAFGVSSPFWDLVFGTMPPSEIQGTPEKKA
ncbi:MAG: sterol desaturase family protein [Flavobacteriales bacterium]|nr:sterol desaturase family protein [Flavobacteriales bacterium]MCX7649313.1 sterol desaturase family protein [Flavobacteriales bacterium]MDW8432900.1 sterol desaturase family protein [Flavobacteriales bacterium]